MRQENEFVSRKNYLKIKERLKISMREVEKLKDNEQTIKILKNTIIKMGKEQKKALNQEEAAKLLGVSVSTFCKWRRNGIVPEHQIDGRLFFIASELIEMIQNN